MPPTEIVWPIATERWLSLVTNGVFDVAYVNVHAEQRSAHLASKRDI